MAKLTIIKESKATRCEICHQSDFFDAVYNTCSRCGNLSSMNLGAMALSNQNYQNYQNYPAPSAYRSQEVIIPKNVAIEELGDTFTIAYNSGSIKNALP